MFNHTYKQNSTVAPEAKQALQQLKAEAARELIKADYNNTDRSNLTSRQNGYVGGYISKSSNNNAIKNKQKFKD